MTEDSNDSIRMLLQALAGQVTESHDDPSTTVSILLTETVRFRDKFKEETGRVLTVEDTRIALDALEQYLRDKTLPDHLTPEQQQLARIYIDRLTMFGE